MTYKENNQMAKKMLAKVVHLHLGAVALGGKMSLQASKSNELEVIAQGVKATSKSSKRSILLPWSNIVDVELYYSESEDVQE